MEKRMANQFRRFITEHRDNLLTWLKSDTGHKEIYLGNAPVEEVTRVVSQHDEALNRIECDEFGKCKECGGEVEPERLELDFTTCESFFNRTSRNSKRICREI